MQYALFMQYSQNKNSTDICKYQYAEICKTENAQIFILNMHKYHQYANCMHKVQYLYT